MTCKAYGVLGGWPGEEKRELGRSEGEAWTLRKPVEASCTDIPPQDYRILVLGQVLQNSGKCACRGAGPKRGLYPFIFTFSFLVIQCLVSFVKPPPRPPSMHPVYVPLTLLLPRSYFCHKHTHRTGSCLFSEMSFPSVLPWSPLIWSVSRLLVNIYHRPSTGSCLVSVGLMKELPGIRVEEGKNTWRWGVRVSLLQHPREGFLKAWCGPSEKQRTCPQRHLSDIQAAAHRTCTRIFRLSPNHQWVYLTSSYLLSTYCVPGALWDTLHTSHFQFNAPCRLLFLLLCHLLSVGIGNLLEEML